MVRRGEMGIRWGGMERRDGEWGEGMLRRRVREVKEERRVDYLV